MTRIFLALSLTACPQPSDFETDSDADTDADGDTDSDTDADSDSDADPDAPWMGWTGNVDPDDGIALRGDREGDLAGGLVATGDLDGDGHADAVVAAVGAFGDEAAAGVVYVAPGPFTADVDLADVATRVRGAEAEDRLGSGLVVADFDGDGNDDLAVASEHPGTDSGVYGRLLVFQDRSPATSDSPTQPA